MQVRVPGRMGETVTDERKPMSQAYHNTHLAFSRATIVEKAAYREPILGLLRKYTADVIQAEQDRVATERTTLKKIYRLLTRDDVNGALNAIEDVVCNPFGED